MRDICFVFIYIYIYIYILVWTRAFKGTEDGRILSLKWVRSSVDLTVLGRRGGFLGPLGASGRPLGNLCEASWASWDVLKASGGLLEASWGLIEASGGVIGLIMGHL